MGKSGMEKSGMKEGREVVASSGGVKCASPLAPSLFLAPGRPRTPDLPLSQASPGSLTSSLVDDVFFILRKCGLRALASGSVQCCTALLTELNNLLANTLRDALAGRMAGGAARLLAAAPALDGGAAGTQRRGGGEGKGLGDVEMAFQLYLTCLLRGCTSSFSTVLRDGSLPNISCAAAIQPLLLPDPCDVSLPL